MVCRRFEQQLKAVWGSFPVQSKEKWKENERNGETSIYEQMQQVTPPNIFDIIGERIEYLFEFTLDRTNEKQLWWCAGEILDVSNGTSKQWKIIEQKDSTKQYNASTAAKVCCDPIKETEEPSVTMIEPFKSRYWKKNCEKQLEKIYWWV